MSNESAIVKRFLKANKPNEYHLITREVYDAMEKIVNDIETNEIDVDIITNKLRSANGHLDQAKLYKEKGYESGVDQNIDESITLVNEAIKGLTKIGE